jgi:hypothetical protein
LGAKFAGSAISFREAEFSGGAVYFGGTLDFDGISGGEPYLDDAKFSGGTVSFGHAEFSGGTVDFSGASDWSFPPVFPWTDTPPPGVKLPRKEDQSRPRLPPASGGVDSGSGAVLSRLTAGTTTRRRQTQARAADAGGP